MGREGEVVEQLVPAFEVDLVGEALDPAGEDLHAEALPRPANRAGSSTSAQRAIA